MVLMLPKVQTFGERVGAGLGAGAGQGISQAMQFAQEMALEDAKMKRRKKLIEGVEGQGKLRDMSSEFLSALPEVEKSMGREMAPEDLDQLWMQLQGSQGQQSLGGEEEFERAKRYSLIGESDLARIETEKGKFAAKEHSRKEEREHQSAEKYLDEARKSKEELFGQQASINSAIQAIHEGKNLTGDWWADLLGLEQLRSAPGAVVQAAAKTHMLTAMNNLSGGRPNMFLEKQIGQAFALPGTSQEANLAKMEILKTLADMKQLQVDKAFEIEDRFEKSGRPVPGKIGRLALKEAEPQIKKRQRALSYNLQELMDPKQGSFELDSIEEVPRGTPLTRRKGEVIFRHANPNSSLEKATEEEISRAVQLAEGLGYDVYASENLE